MFANIPHDGWPVILGAVLVLGVFVIAFLRGFDGDGRDQ